jgi:hypothetical protein
MPALISRFCLAITAISAAANVSAGPVHELTAPAKNEARRIEATMFDLNANLADVGQLRGMLIECGVSDGEASSVAALAQTAADEHAPLRVKLGLSRNPDTAMIGVERLTLSTAAAQAVIEQRAGKLRVVSTAPRKLRII